MQNEILDDLLHEPLIIYEDKSFPEMHPVPRYVLIGALLVFGTGKGLLLTFLVIALGLVLYILSFRLSKTSFKLYENKLVVYNYFFPKQFAVLPLDDVESVEYSSAFVSMGIKYISLQLKPLHRFQEVKNGKLNYSLNFDERTGKVKESDILKVFQQNNIRLIDFFDKKLSESMGADWREQLSEMKKASR